MPNDKQETDMRLESRTSSLPDLRMLEQMSRSASITAEQLRSPEAAQQAVDVEAVQHALEQLARTSISRRNSDTSSTDSAQASRSASPLLRGPMYAWGSPGRDSAGVRHLVEINVLRTPVSLAAAESLGSVASTPRTPEERAERLMGRLLTQTERRVSHALAEINNNLREQLTPQEQALVEAVVALSRGHMPPAEDLKEFPEVAQLVEGARAAMAANPDTIGGTPEAQLARVKCLSHHIWFSIDNDGTSKCARWGRNLGIAALRSGLTVCLTTMLREALGFLLQQHYVVHAVGATTRQTMGVLAMVFTFGLNMMGLAYDEYQGTATWQSRVSRAGMGLLVLGTLLFCVQTGALDLLGAWAPQMLSYTVARDLVNQFFPLGDNAPLSLQGVVCETFVYAAMQFLLSMGMDLLFPNSGSGHVIGACKEMLKEGMARFNATSEVEEAVKRVVAGINAAESLNATADATQVYSYVVARINELTIDGGHVAGRAVLNGLVETFDTLLLPTFMIFANCFKPLRRICNVCVEALQAHRAGRTEGEQAQDVEAQAQARSEAVAQAMVRELRLNVSVGLPTFKHFVDQTLTTGAMRCGAFMTIIAAVAAVLGDIGRLRLPAAQESALVGSAVFFVCLLIYVLFVFVHDKRKP
jgi:hypothetical protein